MSPCYRWSHSRMSTIWISARAYSSLDRLSHYYETFPSSGAIGVGSFGTSAGELYQPGPSAVSPVALLRTAVVPSAEYYGSHQNADVRTIRPSYRRHPLSTVRPLAPHRQHLDGNVDEADLQKAFPGRSCGHIAEIRLYPSLSCPAWRTRSHSPL